MGQPPFAPLWSEDRVKDAHRYTPAEEIRPSLKPDRGTSLEAREETTAQGASFLFGSDDPRAKGRFTGDIVAGILAYGDVRDVVVGTLYDQPWKAILGGIGLTWVGPGADGPYSAFKSGAKMIASVPVAGPRLVMKMADDIGIRVAALKSVGDTGAAIRFISNEADLAMWAARNTDKAVDFERVKNALPADTAHALKDHMPIVTTLSGDLALALGDEPAKAVLKRFSEPGAQGGILAAGGPDAIRDLAELGGVLREAATQEGKDPNTVGKLVANLDEVRNVQGAGDWYAKRIRPNLMSEGAHSGRWGYVFEPGIAASLKMAGRLHQLDDTMFDVYVKNADGTINTIRGPLDAQIDLYKKAADGKRIASEVKSGSGTAISATAKLRAQMERQAAAVAQYRARARRSWRTSSTGTSSSLRPRA